MVDDRNKQEVYWSFEQDHRAFGAPERQFSPTLRIKALAAVILIGCLFWACVWYLVAG